MRLGGGILDLPIMRLNLPIALPLLLLLSLPHHGNAFISYLTCSGVRAFYDDCLSTIAYQERCAHFDPASASPGGGNMSAAVNLTDTCKLQAEHLIWFQTDAELAACNYPSSPLADTFDEIFQFKTKCFSEFSAGPCFTFEQFDADCLGLPPSEVDCTFTATPPASFCELGADEILELVQAVPQTLSTCPPSDIEAIEQLSMTCDYGTEFETDPLIVEMNCDEMRYFSECKFLSGGNITEACALYDPSSTPTWTFEQESLKLDEWMCQFQAEYVAHFLEEEEGQTDLQCDEDALSSAAALEVERFKYECNNFQGPCNTIAKFSEVCLLAGANLSQTSPEQFCSQVIASDSFSSAMNCQRSARLMLDVLPVESAAKCADMAIVNYEVFEQFSFECRNFGPPSLSPTEFLDGPKGIVCQTVFQYQSACIPERLSDEEMHLICEEYYWYETIPGLNSESSLSCPGLSKGIRSIPREEYFICEAELRKLSPDAAMALVQFSEECHTYVEQPPEGPCDFLENLVDDCINGWFDKTMGGDYHGPTGTYDFMLVLCKEYYENSEPNPDFYAELDATCEANVGVRGGAIFFELPKENYDYCYGTMPESKARTMQSFIDTCSELYHHTIAPSSSPTHTPSVDPTTYREGQNQEGGAQGGHGSRDEESSSGALIALTVISMGLCIFVYWQCAIAYYNHMKSGGGAKFSKLDDDAFGDGGVSGREEPNEMGDDEECDGDDVGETYADDGFAYANDDDDDDDDDDEYGDFDDGSSGMELRPLPRGPVRNP